MYTDYCVLKELHNQLGNDLSIFSYNHFRISWYTFLSLLDIEYDCGFKCTECGDHPTTLIMDVQLSGRSFTLGITFCSHNLLLRVNENVEDKSAQ